MCVLSTVILLPDWEILAQTTILNLSNYLKFLSEYQCHDKLEGCKIKSRQTIIVIAITTTRKVATNSQNSLRLRAPVWMVFVFAPV